MRARLIIHASLICVVVTACDNDDGRDTAQGEDESSQGGPGMTRGDSAPTTSSSTVDDTTTGTSIHETDGDSTSTDRDPTEGPVPSETGTTTQNPPCGDNLPFTVSCNIREPDGFGYRACSDYFGGYAEALVGAQCSGDTVELSDQRCGPQTFHVGTCVYFSDDLPDFCYMTHVWSETEDAVAAGREFWRTACSGTWHEE